MSKTLTREQIAICHDCATKEGREPIDGCFGNWFGLCSVCHTPQVCCAKRDYRRPK